MPTQQTFITKFAEKFTESLLTQRFRQLASVSSLNIRNYVETTTLDLGSSGTADKYTLVTFQLTYLSKEGKIRMQTISHIHNQRDSEYI